ncbi:GAF and ANTAR domain-containing protein [Rhodococcus sp. X156]|uniref:GAF and ANTAR domain-containing protein n=1 Tax=Rhodococcus sp. X156 TaxID=2499145 RepID=UPI0013E30AFE|nr:GAF and ANTAR domain-containing protein [Rhodococcus sp. X156]
MGELARTLHRDHGSEDDTLDAVLTAVLSSVVGAEHGTISTVVDRKVVLPKATTDELARRMDEMQTELGEGPCLTAIYEQETLHIADLADEDRWPAFVAAGRAAGIASMLCFQLYVEGDNLGVLNLYSSQPSAFTEESIATGLIFATHAAVAIAGARQERTLTNALVNRDIIGQAKGVVMERFTLDAKAAFDLISRLSQEQNVKLHIIAARIVDDATKSADSS